jgi:hypothetical protein
MVSRAAWIVAALALVAAPAGIAQQSADPQAGVAMARSLPSFAGCFASRPKIRPPSILVACGDGNFFIARIKWVSWTASIASGAGVGHQNDCAPDCARGHFHLYRVSLRLYRPEHCADGRTEFTRFRWSFVGAKPPNVLRAGIEKSPFYISARCA